MAMSINDQHSEPSSPCPMWLRCDGSEVCFRPLTENQQRTYNWEKWLATQPKGRVAPRDELSQPKRRY